MTESKPKPKENRPQPVQVLEAPLRTSLWIAIGIAALGVVWSNTARIPMQVEGLGVIVPPGGLSSLPARATGTIFYQVSPNSNKESPINIRVRKFWNGDSLDEEAIALQGEIRNRKLSRSSVNKILSTITKITLSPKESGSAHEFYPQNHEDIDTVFRRGTVLAIIDSPNDREVLASKLRQTTTSIRLRLKSEERLKTLLKNYISSYKLQSGQQEVVREQVAQQLDWEKTLEKLAKIGWVPRSLYLQASSQVLGLRSNLITANSQLISLLQSIQDSQQKLLQSDTDIKNDLLALRVALFDYLNKAYLIAPTDLYVVNTSFRNQQTITTGSSAFLYTTSNPILPTYITTYFNAKQASQIFPGMKALVTPSGISRAQYGGIIASVERVDTSPSSLEEISAQTGIQEVGQLVNTSQSVPFRVVVKLQKIHKDQTQACNSQTKEECYLWNSGEEPPFPTRLGNTVNVQVTTDTQTPIQLVIPVLRKFLGIATDAS
ncbi:MAG: hypothetical protein FJ083_01465 [Cyanobacteria bacterium K_Offshore_surface_m2_239]|nr:hypothetical protein [Cyanobacteria bacterium K_Offshore_surface_m2_239]